MIPCRTFISIVAFLILLSPPQAYAEIPEVIAIRVLVGEAGDQGLQGMICVGEVLRRRGSIKGFHGYKSKRTKNIPKALRELAAEAWRQSASTNFTQGANHFVSIHAPQPRWVKHCVKTYEYKDHVFYKEIRRRKIKNEEKTSS